MSKVHRVISRRKLIQLAAAGTGLAALSACTPTQAPQTPQASPVSQQGGAPAGSEVVQLTYWHGWAVPHEKAAMDEAVTLFNDAHPNIKVEAVSGKTNDQLITAVSGGNPPDVYAVWSTATLAEWAAKGLILELDEQVRAAGISKDLFYRAAVDISSFQNKWYGLPIVIDAMAVYYNKDLVAEAGFDPEIAPKTLEELFQRAEVLTKVDGAGNITQLGFTGWNLSEALVYMFGGRWWDPATGKPTANDPGNVAAWTLMSNYYRKFGAEKISTFTSEQVSNPLGSQFIAGKAAMAYDGDWITACARVYNPELKWHLFPLPPAEGHDDAAYSTPVDGAIYVVPTGGRHVTESWEVVRWLGTSHEASCVIQKALANASPLREVGEDPNCLPNPEYKVFTDIMSHDKMYVWPPIAVSAFYANERNALADAVNFGKMSPQEALDELQRKVEEELKKVEG